MARPSSILASGAAAVAFLTSAIVLAQVQIVDGPRGKRVVVTTPGPKGQVAQPAIANEMSRLARRSPTVATASAALSI